MPEPQERVLLAIRGWLSNKITDALHTKWLSFETQVENANDGERCCNTVTFLQKRRFATAFQAKDIENAQKQAVPPKTEDATK